MSQDPIAIIIITSAGVFAAVLWGRDFRRNRAGSPHPMALPGAVGTTFNLLVLAAAGALGILGLETAGEYALDISLEQSNVTWLFLAAMTAAAFLEELIFRGFLVVENKGRAALVGSILGFSLLFALMHFHWIEWKGPDSGWVALKLTPSALWWTLILFANSLWFYFVRFFPLNRNRSLLPSIAAHLAGNWGVFVIKLLQGHVTAIY